MSIDMKPELQLKLSQQLAITPQLQQSIKLLQLSSVELLQQIELALENNPLLERSLSYEESDSDSETRQEAADTFDYAQQSVEPDEFYLDNSWNDLTFSTSFSPSQRDLTEESLYQTESSHEQSLQDYLIWQANLTPFTDEDHAIALAIIDAIDDRGYFTASPKTILESIGRPSLTIEEVNVVLKRIQHFDPPGIGASDLPHTLLLQLEQMSDQTPFVNEAKQLISQHLELLAEGDLHRLGQITQLAKADLKNTVRLIRSLKPYPGHSFVANETNYTLPDVTVKKHNGHWRVQLNTSHLPHLKINPYYGKLSPMLESDKQFIRNNLQEARWFIKSIENRNETLLRVAQAIVDYQKNFFDYGIEKMRPMILSDIAHQLNLHESTISRITTQKYLYAPCGLFELKYFFSSHISREKGNDVSSTTIRALIKKLISTESPNKPLSDSKLAKLLAEQGIEVARRTVTKYRESLSISASSSRKKLVL